MLESLRRIIQPSITKNNKNSSYMLSEWSSEDARAFLSAELAGGGVFGIETHIALNKANTVLFVPCQYKVALKATERDPIFESLIGLKEATFIQASTKNASIFPLNMYDDSSLLTVLKEKIPEHIGIIYQIILVYRQDNWNEKLYSQYADYLDGIENPANTETARNVQKNILNYVNRVVKWEQKNAPIPELEQKLKENGFRFNIKFVLYNGTSKERKEALKVIQLALSDLSYTNDWLFTTPLFTGDFIKEMTERRINNMGKPAVLCVSELLPLITKPITKPFNLNKVEADIKDSESSSKSMVIDEKNIEHSKENLINLLPKGIEISQEDGRVVAQQFIIALKQVSSIKNAIAVNDILSGPTMMRITYKVPSNFKLSDVTKKSTIENIQTQMGKKHLMVKQGEEIGEMDLWVQKENRDIIFLRDYIETKEFIDFAKKKPLPFFVGTDEIGRPIYKCLNEIRHILVAGTTGSGKSVWVNQLILTLLLYRTPQELLFYMIDVKQVELPIYENFPHVKEVTVDADRGILLLKQLIAEMNRRYTMFSAIGVKDIALYNQQAKKLPYIVCVVDEYAELALRNDEVHGYVQSLAQLSRATGIHLIIATQDPRVEVIPGIIKSNLPGKIGLRCSNSNSYKTFLNTKPPFNLLGNGDGTMSFEGQLDEHVRFQGCLIVHDPKHKGLESKIIKNIASRMKPYQSENLPEVREETELDKLKRIIASTNETRVSQLRNEMKININRLNSLMKELVEEDWLEKPENKQSGYKLIASKEELTKYQV